MTINDENSLILNYIIFDWFNPLYLLLWSFDTAAPVKACLQNEIFLLLLRKKWLKITMLVIISSYWKSTKIEFKKKQYITWFKKIYYSKIPHFSPFHSRLGIIVEQNLKLIVACSDMRESYGLTRFKGTFI